MVEINLEKQKQMEKNLGCTFCPEGECAEMYIDLLDYSEKTLQIPDVTYKFFDGQIQTLKQLVSIVDYSWPEYFNNPDTIFCGYYKGQLASFCLVESNYDCIISKPGVNTGTIGCVGTLPEFRKKGIGLRMVDLASMWLKEQKCQVSYISYTHIDKWYEKLGYKTFARFTLKMTTIQEILFKHQDVNYGDFLAKLVPTEPREAFIGIRSPEYKKILKEILVLPEEETSDFCRTLPHKYHEENAVHIALINSIKDYEQCLKELENFLPYITNWAISDSLRPKIFEKNKDKLIQELPKWIMDSKPYTIRVGILMLMKFYLDEDFKTEYLQWPSSIRSEEYYVNMMTAWFFAEALVKQWDSAIVYIQENKLDTWTHNKAIQKARESFRISPEQKEYLNSLKIKSTKKLK